jgi:hypothetical protein
LNGLGASACRRDAIDNSHYRLILKLGAEMYPDSRAYARGNQALLSGYRDANKSQQATARKSILK